MKKIDSLSAGKQAVPTVEEVKPHTAEAAVVAPATPKASVEKPAEKQAEPTPAPDTEPTAIEQAAISAPETPVDPAANPDSFDALFPEPASIGKPPSWLWWVILLIVSLMLGIVGYALAQKNLRQWLALDPTPTPKVSASATPSLTPTATPSAISTATPTPTPTPGAVDNASVTLRVLNGSTTTGAAGKAATALTSAGFKVRTTGNAKTQNYPATIVYYQTGRLAEAQAVQNALTRYSVTLQESSLADPDMILVVIGKK